MTCKAIRQGDQMQCPTCGLSWDVNEERPECQDNGTTLSTMLQRERSLKRIRNLRKRHGLKGRNYA